MHRILREVLFFFLDVVMSLLHQFTEARFDEHIIELARRPHWKPRDGYKLGGDHVVGEDTANVSFQLCHSGLKIAVGSCRRHGRALDTKNLVRESNVHDEKCCQVRFAAGRRLEQLDRDFTEVGPLCHKALDMVANVSEL
ncbi:hypothetical protein HG530_015716 [Fusarium avenaceum]|nr:hypothetical protein HG530_015716 [Fusarium avenaceum]